MRKNRKKFLFVPMIKRNNLLRAPLIISFQNFLENKYLNFEGIILISTGVFYIDIGNYNFVRENRKKFLFVPLKKVTI